MDDNMATKEDMLELVSETVSNLNERIDMLTSVISVMQRNMKDMLDLQISREEDDGEYE